MKSLKCMSYVGKDQAQIVAAGHQDMMFRVDVEKGTVVEKVQYTDAREASYGRLIGSRSALNTSTS